MRIQRVSVLWVLLLCCVAFTAPQVRHVGSTPGVSLGYGYSTMSQSVHVGWTYRWSNAWAGHVWGAYHYQLGRTCYYQEVVLQPGIAWSAASYCGTLYWNLLGGGFGSYSRQASPAVQSWNTGPWLGMDLECLLTDKLLLRLGGYVVYYALKNPYGHWDSRATVSVQWDLRPDL